MAYMSEKIIKEKKMELKENIILQKNTERLDDYFKSHSIVIKAIPDSLLQDIDEGCDDHEILSVREFEEFLNQEMEFWKKNDPNKQLELFSNSRNINHAINRLREAKYLSDNPDNYNIAYVALKESINYVKNSCLYSKTSLADFLITECLDKTIDYIEGVRAGLSSSRRKNAPTTIDGITGFYAALGFLDSLNSSGNYLNIQFQELKKKVAIVNEGYSELERKCVSYEKTMEDIELTFRERLKLKKPAQTWEITENEYKKKAGFWVVMSVLTAVIIIGVLILVLSQLPHLFSANSHWLDIFKNSAIFTIVLSICVYILRFFVKLSTSSFHLSRDAKERHNLAYVYLALIQEGAVSDEERTIVLNALFSRADTGLLKGDSSPTMPANMNDVIKGLTK